MSEISLRMTDGTQIVLPASLNAITTYVILEQEKWFEKETAFLAHWLKPGMNVIDIGANLGVYSLPMARLVGPDGHVFAYEPASETRRLLKISKKKNRANNLHIIEAALSDGEREGHLVHGTSSELNTLEGVGSGETVKITSLDAEDRARDWGRIDFLKIDAEGEEERILKGGKDFLAHHTPLIMFEIKHAKDVSLALRAAFVAEGYRIFRLLGEAAILVPVAESEPLDSFELNLFAVHPDRVGLLAKEGFLVETIPTWSPVRPQQVAALDLIKAQTFAPAFAQLFQNVSTINEDYHDALAAYASWRSTDSPLPNRVAALSFARQTLLDLCIKEISIARLSTLARIAWEYGDRATSVNALKTLSNILKKGTGRMSEPFWPASSRFDSIDPQNRVMEWFVVSVLEPLEQTAAFSSIGGNSLTNLDWLASQPFVSAEIDRRRVLRRASAGQLTDVPDRLLKFSHDHVNANNWRDGSIPNTRVSRKK